MVKKGYLHKELMLVMTEEQDRKELRKHLSRMGFENIREFIDSKACLEFLQNEKRSFELAIVEIELGADEEGIELAHELLNNYRIPFVFYTASLDSDLLNKAAATIPYGIITKPVNPALLEFTIETTFTLIELRKLLTIKNEDLGRANKLIIEQKTDLLHGLESAAEIQRNILPDSEGLGEYFEDHFIFNEPKSLIGGDFFWNYKMDDNQILFAGIDCTGHAVSGSLVSILVNNHLNRIVRDYGVSEPADILWLVDRQIVKRKPGLEPAESIPAGMDLMLCLFNKKEMSLRFSGARRPLVLVRNGELEYHKGHRVPVGLIDIPQKGFKRHKIQLEKGDQLYLYSDGFVDQLGGPKNKKYKSKNFKDLLLANAHLSHEEQYMALKKEMRQWRGRNSQTDDVLVIGLKI